MRNGVAPLRVMVLGLRGFPEVQGGIETHAERLLPRIAAAGCEVQAIVRSPYMGSFADSSWGGVSYCRLWSPRSRGLEALVHSILGVLVAAIKRPDVLHIHGIGPALVTPLARLCGLRVVVTHHGIDYNRQKWGRIAKTILRWGEACGMRFSHRRIAISHLVEEHVRRLYGKDCVVIPNGVDSPDIPGSADVLRRLGLTARQYVLTVARIVPEKRQLDLIKAFEAARLPGWKLVIAGAADHHSPYASQVKTRAEATPDVVLAGFQSGTALRELYAHAGLFVLPSSHEGMPIAMLEAMSYGLRVIASDIAPNIAIGLSAEHYFPLGDISRLADRLRAFSSIEWAREQQALVRAVVKERHDWSIIAGQTLSTYRAAGGIRP